MVVSKKCARVTPSSLNSLFLNDYPLKGGSTLRPEKYSIEWRSKVRGSDPETRGLYLTIRLSHIASNTPSVDCYMFFGLQ